MRCAPDFCRGFTPTVCANIYTATDLCPASISRLQRKQVIGCTDPLAVFVWSHEISITLADSPPNHKYESRFPRSGTRGAVRVERALLPASGPDQRIFVLDTRPA
jgi:hypothetical protein